MPEASHETLLAYLRQHGERYTLEALRKSLLGQGFEAAAVEAACQSYLAETPKTGPKLSMGEEILRGCAAVGVTVMALAVLLVGSCTIAFFFMMGSEAHNDDAACWLTLIIFALIVLVPANMILRAMQRSRTARRVGGRDEGPAPSLTTAPEEVTETKTTHETLLTYLHEHAPTTGVEEMRADLLAQGYDPEDVHAAFVDSWSRGDSR